MEPVSLTALAAEQIAHARAASSGRSARSLHVGREHRLRQTVLALAAGRALDEHENPGEATVQVLTGRVRLLAGDEVWQAGAGDYLIVPPRRHSLEALDESAILLTTALDLPGAE